MNGDGKNELIVATRIDEGRTPMVRLFSLRKFRDRPRYAATDFSMMQAAVRAQHTYNYSAHTL